MKREMFHGEARKWFTEREEKLESVGVHAQYDEIDNGSWTEPIAKIETTRDNTLDRAANLMSENHSTFTLEVIARLKDFAEIGGRYSTEAATVIKALSELDRTRRVVELEREAQEHVNAAPVDGNPLNAIVNLEIDSTASDYAREKIARYLADNGYEATLENIAAGYIYDVDSLDELQADVAGREYVVSRITTLTGTSIQDGTTSHTIYETRFIASAPLPDGSVMFTSKNKRMSEFAGEEYDGYRIVKVLEPGGYATNGGVIMERTKDGE